MLRKNCMRQIQIHFSKFYEVHLTQRIAWNEEELEKSR